MALLEKAIDYVIDMVTENEEVKQFPKDFVTASAQWIRTWFLVDDAVTSSVLQNPELPEAVKKPVVEAKLNTLKDKPEFVEELKAQLARYEEQKANIQNLNENSGVQAGRDNIENNQNSAIGSSISAGRDVRFGDENNNISGNNIQINNNYFGNKPNEPENSKTPTALAQEVTNFLRRGQTTEAIGCLLEGTEKSNRYIYEDALLLSARNARLAMQERRGVVSSSDANTERNRINAAIGNLLDEL